MNLQWSKRWSTVSPSQQHKQHQLTQGRFIFTRLSIVRILSQVAVHKKKETLLGILTLQIHFQGKGMVGGADKELYNKRTSKSPFRLTSKINYQPPHPLTFWNKYTRKKHPLSPCQVSSSSFFNISVDRDVASMFTMV